MALRIDTKDEEAASTAITDMQVLSFSPSHNDNHLGQLAQISWYLGMADPLVSTLSPKPSTLNLQPSNLGMADPLASTYVSDESTAPALRPPPSILHPPPSTLHPPHSTRATSRRRAGLRERRRSMAEGKEGSETLRLAGVQDAAAASPASPAAAAPPPPPPPPAKKSQPYTVNHNPSSRSPEEGCCYSSVSWQTSQPYTANHNPQALREDAAAAALTPDGTSEEHAQRRESMGPTALNPKP